MKKKVILGAHGAVAIVAIVFIVAFYSPTYGLAEDYTFLSERMCGPNSVSVYRASPPLYRGGVTRHSNVVCYPKGTIIEAEGFGTTFPDGKIEEPWRIFDRFRKPNEILHNTWRYD